VSQTAEVAERDAQLFRDVHQKVKREVQRFIVGQERVLDATLTALFAGGHVMLEGVPGLGKTMLVRSIGQAVDVGFSRIQFTPDMMPADIQGTNVLVETEGGGHELQFQQGPLVSNLVLADEINRATPRTQSALLEAMQERQISVGRRKIQLHEPFCVMATQNPVEQEGTYPLPEAQLDRFLMKIVLTYPKFEEYAEIVDRTTGDREVEIRKVSSGDEVRQLRHIARAVPVPERAKDYAIRLVVAAQPKSEFAPAAVDDYVGLGPSPRAVQSLILAAKVRALVQGRFAVATDDIAAVAHDVMRHRILVNFHGQADGVTPDHLIDQVFEKVQMPND